MITMIDTQNKHSS